MVDVVTGDGQWRYLESVPPALLTPTDIAAAAEMLGKASTVVLQLQQPAAAILAALDQVPPDCRVIMDGVPEDEPTRERILAAATVLRLDAQEAEILASQRDPRRGRRPGSCRGPADRGPELVVIAVGTDGNLVAWPGDAILLPLVDAAEVVDTTGSGDAFVAGLTWALVRGADRVRAGQLATAAAGLTVGHPGGRPTLTAAEVEELADAARGGPRMSDDETRSRSSPGSSGRSGWTRTTWPGPSRCSPCPTAISGSAAPSTRVSPTTSPARTSTRSSSPTELTYPESGYGYPDSGQSIVNVPNGKIIRLLVDDEPFDVRYGRLLGHERTLDFRAGTLRREVEWETPAGRRVRVRSTRLVSLSQRAVLAIRYEVEPVDTPSPGGGPVGAAGQRALARTRWRCRGRRCRPHPLIPDGASIEGTRACLMYRTRHSGLRLAAAVDHVLTADQELDPEMTSDENWVRLTASTELAPGQRLALTKFVAYGWSAERSDIALKDQVDAALTAAVETGWDGLLAAQREYLDAFWARADVEVDGDPKVQQAVRFGLFHLLQASARAEQRAIPAKGLTGTGYAGHAFWETEAFVLPVLTATVPGAAADALRWRRATLPMAKEWARTLRLRGAAFAWRTIRGEECSSYWPAGTAAFHVNADIAVAAARQVRWTQDADFDRECALPLLVETARLWQCLGYVGADGHFHLDGVTGPDEYSALVNDNTFTNLAAAANLREAAAAAGRWPDAAADLGVDTEEIAGWRQSADRDGRGLRRRARDARAGPRLDASAALGLRRVRREGRVPAAQPRDRTSTCTASRWPSRPTWCWPCSGSANGSPSPRRRRRSRTPRS